MNNMTKTQTRTQLSHALFSAADVLRAKMDANEYKNYLLGIVFFKYLSDKLLYQVGKILGPKELDLKRAQILYEENNALHHKLKVELGYAIQPRHTFTYLMGEIEVDDFEINDLASAFKDIEDTEAEFSGLFDDVDLTSQRLGNTKDSQTQTIAQVMIALKNIELVKTEGDTLGDAYEFLIGQFASESGKKAGEFYTPQKVSELITRLTLIDNLSNQNIKVCDPAMGSGSLLLNFKKYVPDAKQVTYFGQEINVSTYNLARMNMILHGVSPSQQHLRLGNTLESNWPNDSDNRFDAVVMNPPYSLKWSADEKYLRDPRFSEYGVLPPKSKADYAFLLHGLFHLKEHGRMAIVLPQGVLFRESSEGTIRRKLLEKGVIDAIIGLPGHLFYNTPIPAIVIVLKKDKTDRSILFIDASKDFEKENNQNVLREQDVQRILTTYQQRKEVDKYCHIASFEEIQENDYNLNISRYIDTLEKQQEINLKTVAADLVENRLELNRTGQELIAMLKNLRSDDVEVMEGLNDIIHFFEGEYDD